MDYIEPNQARLDNYNLTKERYRAIWDSQGGKCAVCMNGNRRLVIDHDHMCCPGLKSCGFCIRGLLCTQCNAGIGMFNDNHMTMARAKNYVFDSRKARGLIKGNPKTHKQKREAELQGPFGKTWDDF